MMRISRILSLVLVAVSSVPVVTFAQTSRTQIVMLGTGTPIPDPDRMGSAVAIVVDSVAYLFDAGTGVVRRAAAAGRNGIKAFAPATPKAQPAPKFDRVFLTHLHSDHTLGLADVIFTPWIQGREAPLDIYGPPGTQHLVKGILDANAEDINERAHAFGGPPRNGWNSVVHEIAEGEVFRDARITVTAFAVPHADWKYAFGYKVQTPDRTIVISGDTRPTDAIAKQCNGCDVLIHEVYGVNSKRTENNHFVNGHTNAFELGELAARAKPKLLILNHQMNHGVSADDILGQIGTKYSGRVVWATDLAVY